MSSCEFAINGNCQISTDMAGIPVPLHDGACRACLSLPDAKLPGSHVVTDRACWALRQAGHREKAYALRLASDKRMIDKASGADAKKAEMRKRVVQGKEKTTRLISWLKWFRVDSDKGIGDTAARLVQQKKKSPIYIASDARDAVNRLLKQCSCSRVDAVARLNEKYPY